MLLPLSCGSLAPKSSPSPHPEDHLLVLLEGVPQVDDLPLLLPQHLLQVAHGAVRWTWRLVTFLVLQEGLVVARIDIALPRTVRPFQTIVVVATGGCGGV